MDLSLIISGLKIAFSPSVILFVAIGVVIGVVIGAIPGLSATMAIALMTPVTFGMSPINGIGLLLGVYCGAMFGGSIAAILINAPGTPAATATCFDGYPMAKNGEAVRAMKMALAASFIGGIISCIILSLTSSYIASYALKFGPGEYFAIVTFSLVIIVAVCQGNMIKGFISAIFGLLLACVGQDPILGTERLCFGNLSLSSGIDSTAMLIGLFATAELFIFAEKRHEIRGRVELHKLNPDQKLPLRDIICHWKTLLRGSIMGCLVGALPGIGGSTMAYINYNITMNGSKDPKSFGQGNIAGVAAVECTNNGSTGGVLIPLLTLGIPGDTVSAMLLGALTIQGLAPGPVFFRNNGKLIYAIFACMFIANLIMLAVGTLSIHGSKYLAKIPANLLWPIVLSMCVVGSYASASNTIAIAEMIIFGILGYVMKKIDMPISPMIIAYVLGDLFESNMRRAYSLYRGNMWQLFKSPLCVIFLSLAVVFLVVTLRKNYKVYQADKQEEKMDAGN